MKKILTLIVSAALCFTLTTLISACDNGSNRSGWNLEKMEAENGEALEYYALIQLTRNNGKTVKELWLNAENVADGEIVFSVTLATSLTSTATTSKDYSFIQSDFSSNDGWVRVFADVSYSYSYIEIASKNAIKLNEVVFVDSSNSVITETIVKAGVRPNKDSASKKEYTASELKKWNPDYSATSSESNATISTSEKAPILIESIYDALFIVDEQDSFNRESLLENIVSVVSSSSVSSAS